jgi:hypothetical protein
MLTGVDKQSTMKYKSSTVQDMIVDKHHRIGQQECVGRNISVLSEYES